MWVYSLVKQQQYMLTVYCTRWWIRQRFTTICIYNINSTYSHRNWCVYVLYPGVMTITRGGASLGRGGGFCPRGGNTTSPGASRTPLFFERVKKTMKNPRLQKIQSYKHCILKLHHKCVQQKQSTVLIMRVLIHDL